MLSSLRLVTRRPAQRLEQSVALLSAYAERGIPHAAIETAPLTFPLVFSLGTPWRIGLGAGIPCERPLGFAAGLFPGPIEAVSTGAAVCVQADLTPSGALRLFGSAAADMAGSLVALDQIPQWGSAALELREQLAETADWDRRFDLVEAFIGARLVNDPFPALASAWQELESGKSVAGAAKKIGWSERYFTIRFKAAIGIAPVTARRMLRFHRAVGLARTEEGKGWAEVATVAGYADQSHLIREFRVFAGESPTNWARRAAMPASLQLE